ncbi:helix-turn-helix domain-containing protein [Streptomyces sp. NPDC002932]|uniref:helix-turn-helix domain-containing protein n=1 Tax=Streptomyces sp. NPDC002932 TaxID=3364672 RepID=UPI0036BA5644
MATVHHWTGLEARALRLALRMSVRTFAAHLGVGTRTISKWEKLLSSTAPRQDTQAILDTALARAEAAVHHRFETSLSEAGRTGAGSVRRTTASGPQAWEYETWADDLERAAVCLSRQDFSFAGVLLGRWLRCTPRELDEKGRYLYARSLTLAGDRRRLEGSMQDLLSAASLYRDAHSMFIELGIPRRAAQIQLTLAVVAEMSGRLSAAASRYEALTSDERLSARDRARARLWIGTALAKQGHAGPAIALMRSAAEDFHDLAEPEEWAVSQQKLALAHRGIGDLTRALCFMDTARSVGRPHSPLEHVQIDTAQAHILLSDPATADEGRAILAGAAHMAGKHGLKHQLRSIETIRDTEEHAWPRSTTPTGTTPARYGTSTH